MAANMLRLKIPVSQESSQTKQQGWSQGGVGSELPHTEHHAGAGHRRWGPTAGQRSAKAAARHLETMTSCL